MSPGTKYCTRSSDHPAKPRSAPKATTTTRPCHPVSGCFGVHCISGTSGAVSRADRRPMALHPTTSLVCKVSSSDISSVLAWNYYDDSKCPPKMNKFRSLGEVLSWPSPAHPGWRGRSRCDYGNAAAQRAAWVHFAQLLPYTSNGSTSVAAHQPRLHHLSSGSRPRNGNHGRALLFLLYIEPLKPWKPQDRLIIAASSQISCGV
jgi:hypothetical protein